MNINELYSLLNKPLKVSVQIIDGKYHFETKNDALDQLLKYSTLDPYKQTTDKLISSAFLFNGQEKNIVSKGATSNTTYFALRKLEEDRKFHLWAISEYVDHHENPNSNRISLPKYASIDEISKSLHNIKLSIELPSRALKADFKFVNFEKGSIWAVVFVGAAIKVISLIIDTGYKAYFNKKKAEAATEYVKSLKMGNDYMKTLFEAQSKMTEEMFENISNQIVKEEKLSIENKKLIENAMVITQQMIESGAKFLPSINAADSVKQIFDSNIKEMQTIGEAPFNKLLESKN